MTAIVALNHPMAPMTFAPYPARLDITYPQSLNRVTTLFRIILAVPILFVLGLLSGGGDTWYFAEAGEVTQVSGGGIAAGLFVATALMLVLRQRYPRWWFDFALELGRFTTRVAAYLLLLTDRYPSTTDAQSVHLEVDYPESALELNRWLPLVKWILALPHYLVLAVLGMVMVLVTMLAWIIILVTAHYPRALFDFVVGVMRWSARVWAYAFLLVTDVYPPFSLR